MLLKKVYCMSITPNPSDQDRLSFRQDLFRDLRMELGQLKGCQIQTLTLGVSGAGLMLGLIDKDPASGRVVLFLLPLAIILPLWTIFFDKARTISRIIGFIRVQEDICVNNQVSILIGWETGMKNYWALKEKLWDSPEGKQEINKKLKEINYNEKGKLKSRSKLFNSFYWATSFIVFVLLSVACLLLSIRNLPFDWEKCAIPLMAMSVFTTITIYVFVIYLTPDLIELQSFILHVIIVSTIFTAIFLIIELFCLAPTIIVSNPISIDSARIVGFNLALFGFIFTSTLNFWLFKNLVRARYSTAAFEKRWEMIITHLDKESQDKRVMGKKEQKSLP